MDKNIKLKQALQYKPKDEGTQGDRGRDGGTNFTLRIKEQETRLTIHGHDGDDDDDDGDDDDDDDDDDDMIVLIHERKWLRSIVDILMYLRQKQEVFLTNDLNIIFGTGFFIISCSN